MNYRFLPSFIRCILAYKTFGGPIEEVTFSYQEVYPQKRGYMVNSNLRDSLIDSSKMKNVLYKNCTGSGSDEKPFVALEKAISESLERWAYFEVSTSNKKNEYGFDIDLSTNGMAAHPNIFLSRKNSFLEALERWAIRSWWHHGLKQDLNIHNDILEIVFEFKRDGHTQLKEFDLNSAYVTITYKKEGSYHTYGFGNGHSRNASIFKAEIERIRNRDILNWLSVNPNTMQIKSEIEKMLLFYSNDHGHSIFQKVIEQNKSSDLKNFEIIFSKELFGPWSKWASVYRTILKTDAAITENKIENYSTNFPF